MSVRGGGGAYGHPSLWRYFNYIFVNTLVKLFPSFDLHDVSARSPLSHQTFLRHFILTSVVADLDYSIHKESVL